MVPLCLNCLKPTLFKPLSEFSGNSELPVIHSAGVFTGPLRDLIHRFKFLGKDYLAEWLAEQCVELTSALDNEPDCVVPIPMSSLRRWRRGYNQAQLLAEKISKLTQLPMVDDFLSARLFSRSQINLNRRQRAANAKTRYQRSRRKIFQYQRPLLVDDVATTGATLIQCAKLLRMSGAEHVEALVVARDEMRP